MAQGKVTNWYDSVSTQNVRKPDVKEAETHINFVAMQDHIDSLHGMFSYLQGADGNQQLLADLEKLQATFNDHVTRYFLRWNGADYLRDTRKETP